MPANPARRPLCPAPAGRCAPRLSRRRSTHTNRRALTTTEVEQQIYDFVRCTRLALAAGYDGVEIMGSEGYLINQFLSAATNRRTDRGAAAMKTACGFRWPSSNASARPSDLSSSSYSGSP